MWEIRKKKKKFTLPLTIRYIPALAQSITYFILNIVNQVDCTSILPIVLKRLTFV